MKMAAGQWMLAEASAGCGITLPPTNRMAEIGKYGNGRVCHIRRQPKTYQDEGD